jgi:hypothetical protein
MGYNPRLELEQGDLVDTERVDSLMRFIVLTAGQSDEFRDRAVGPIHLIKYLYLADLAYASRNNGRTFTGIRWKFHHFGPWAGEAYQRMDPALLTSGAERHILDCRYGDKENVRWIWHDDVAFQKTEKELPHVVTSTVRRTFREFGTDTYPLLHHIYRTAPMVHAAPEEELDFSHAVSDDNDQKEIASSQQSEALSIKKMKSQKQRMDDLRARVNAKIAEKRTSSHMVVPDPPPRYDEIFAQGVEWLDMIGGGPVPEYIGEVEFDDSLWKHPARTESDAP